MARPYLKALTGLLLVTALFISCSAREPASDPNRPLGLEVNLSTNTIRIGDPVTLTLSVIHPVDSILEIPDPSQDKKIILKNRVSESSNLSGGRLFTTVEYRLTSLSVGEHLVATGSVACLLPNEERLEEPIPETTLTVVTSLSPRDDNLRSWKGLALWEKRFPRWAYGILIILLLALVASLLARQFLKREAIEPPPPPPEPADQIALRALRILRENNWIEQGYIEPFFVEISSIVRQYLENRFDLRAPEQTTEEFIRETSESNALSMNHKSVTREFLQQSDLVKFAKFRPGPVEMESAFTAAENLVQETRRAEAL